MKNIQLRDNNVQVPEHGLKSIHCLPGGSPIEDLRSHNPSFFLVKHVLVLMDRPSGLPRYKILMKAQQVFITFLPPFFLDVPPVRTYIKGMRQCHLVQRVITKHSFQVIKNSPKNTKVSKVQKSPYRSGTLSGQHPRASPKSWKPGFISHDGYGGQPH